MTPNFKTALALALLLTACAGSVGERPAAEGGETLPYPEVTPIERDYQRAYCMRPGWKIEVTLPDSRKRADCISPEYAVELDWVYKWRQCLDQAALYAQATGLKPLCVLIEDVAVTPALRETITNTAAQRGIELDWIGR